MRSLKKINEILYMNLKEVQIKNLSRRSYYVRLFNICIINKYLGFILRNFLCFSKYKKAIKIK